MQFLALAFMGFVALFVGTFFVSGLSGAIDDFSIISTGSRSGTSFSERIRSARRSGSAGEVLGANTALVAPLPYDGDIVSALNDASGVSRFRKLFHEVNGAAFIDGATLYTLFVPTDAAFAALPYETQARLNTVEGDALTRLITYHLVPQKMVAVAGDIKTGTVAALSRDALNFELRDTGGTVGNAHVTRAILAGNGIVYVIDGVLLPPERPTALP